VLEEDTKEVWSMDVRNCKSCGNLFNYVGRNICPACARRLEERFDKVKQYIRENPGATIGQVAEENEVSVNQIRNWIREERLELSKESAIGIECERCGKLIKVGRMCEACKRAATNDLMEVSKAAKKPKPVKQTTASDNKNRMRYLNGN